jgi:ATP-dependent helicase/DNAse subunit B
VTGEIITSENFHASFAALKERLARRTVSLDERHYAIVPDKCSIFAERLLFEGGGAFDAEVLSFDRFYLRFHDESVSFLPRAGAVMLLKKVIGEVKKDLRVFKTSVDFAGFGEKMYDTVCALSAAGVEPDDLLRVQTDSAAG